MSDLIQEIRAAQVRAGEEAVVANLQKQGLIPSPAAATPQNDGGSAFPFTPPFDATGCTAAGYTDAERGMTLRDHFAGQAMQAYLSGHIAHHGHENHWPVDALASEAYGVADAMIRARSAC